MVDSGKPLIPGPYRVLKEIKSYRNRVFLCEDEQSWKKLAIKEQKGVFTSANELVSCCLFTRLCHLIHPNVMRMYRVECDAEDNAFLVAEFVKGKRADLLIHGTGFPAVIPEDFAFTPGLDLKKLTILRDVAAALDYIHRCGVLHLDVKPSNVIVSDDGHAKLIDFDLAACINGGQVDRHGRKCGTPPYMAPEIWRCKPLTPATDQWALAVFAYELISGQWPYWVENSMNRYWSEDFPLYRSWNSYSVSRVFGILRTRNESRTVSSVVTCDGGPGERYLQDIAEVILRGGERKLDCVSQQANCVLNRAMSCSPGARFGSCSEFVRALGDAEHLNGTHEKTVALIAPAESNVLFSEKGSSDLEHVPPESESQKRPDISRDSQDNPDIPYSKWAVVVKWIVFVAFSSWVCVISTLSASITCFLWLMGLDALTRSKKYKALTKNGRMCMFALYVGLGGLMAVSASVLCDQFIASFQDRESPVSDRTPISLYDAAQNDYNEGNYESAIRNVVELRDDKYIVSDELKRKAAHLAALCHVKLGNDTAVANWRKLCGCSQCLSDLGKSAASQLEPSKKKSDEQLAHEHFYRGLSNGTDEWKEGFNIATNLATVSDSFVAYCVGRCYEAGDADDAVSKGGVRYLPDYAMARVEVAGEVTLERYLKDGRLREDLAAANPALDLDHLKAGTMIDIPIDVVEYRKAFIKFFSAAKTWYEKAVSLNGATPQMSEALARVEIRLANLVMARDKASSSCRERESANIVDTESPRISKEDEKGTDNKPAACYTHEMGGVKSDRAISDGKLKNVDGNYTETINGVEWTYNIANGNASIEKARICEGATRDLEVPAKLGGCQVVDIEDLAFEECYTMTSATLPQGVTNIGFYAFAGCQSLKSLKIPPSVVRIHSGAFKDCSSLKSVTIPRSVTRIIQSTFEGCSSLDSVTIPSSVTSIGGSAFAGCKSLSLVIIPSSVRKIMKSAFEGTAIKEVQVDLNDGERIKSLLKMSGANIDDLTFKEVSETECPEREGAYTDCVEYVVQRGDYLAKVSKKFNVSVAAIKRLNPSIKNDVFRIGQKIKIPAMSDLSADPIVDAKTNSVHKTFVPYSGPTKEYVVASGDTLGSIAYRNVITIRQLKTLNNLTADTCRVGQILIVPDKQIQQSPEVDSKDSRKGWMFR